MSARVTSPRSFPAGAGFSANMLVALAILGFGMLAGAASVCIKVLVEELTPLQVVAGQTVAGAGAVLGVMALTRAMVPLTPAFARGIFLLALLDGVAPYLLTATGQVHVSSATGAILLSTMPLFTMILATLVAKQSFPGVVGMVGLGTGFGGVVVLAGPAALDVGSSSTAGMAAILGAAACYAGAAVYARRLLSLATPLALTGVKLAVTVAIVVPVMLIAEGGVSAYTSLSGEAWLAFAALGVGTTGLGRCIYLWALGKAGSVKASTVTYIAPVFAIVLSWALLGETVDARMLGGAALIVSGVGSVMLGSRLQTAATKWLADRRAPVASVATGSGWRKFAGACDWTPGAMR